MYTCFLMCVVSVCRQHQCCSTGVCLKRKSSINDDLVGGLMVIFDGDFS